MAISKTTFNMPQLLRVTITVAIFFLAFLGMRNPHLNGSPAPKQRPRAILENIIKASDSIVQSILVQGETNEVLNVSPQVSICYSAPTPLIIRLPFPTPFALVARAPPYPATA